MLPLPLRIARTLGAVGLLGLAGCAAAGTPSAAMPAAAPPAAASAGSAPAGKPGFEPDIPYQKYILPNGLTLLIHEDHKAPIVAVNVWYHVGSKDESPGRTGFAHLFEHLMFQGSEHHHDEFFRPLEAVGASKANGTTWFDRTNYFENVPTSALDMTLWLESDRMGHLVGAIDQATLDEQREVVLNEKRQGENEPYGRMDALVARETYPMGHPYSWTSIGSEADLNAAVLPDVKNWFRERYGAANAVLVIAGDVVPADVKKKVELYFGDIPSGPTLTRHGPWVAKMTGTKRATMQDRVPQARVYKVWNVPGFCDRDTNVLQLAADVLGGGKTSRLYERLVHRDRLVTSIGADVGPFEIGSQFTIDALVAPGGDPQAVEKAIDEELARFLKDGPTREELDRVRTGYEADFVRGLERIDGFSGKSATLAEYQVYCGSPDWYKNEFRWTSQASGEDVRKTAAEWLSDGQFVLTVEPFPEYTVAKTGADRSKLPTPGPAPSLDLPPLRRDRLSNGMEILVAERHSAPVVQFSLIFDAGTAADVGAKPGTAKMTLDMLDEGAGDLDSLAFARRKEELGAQIGMRSGLDTSYLFLNALTGRLAESLDLFATLVEKPTFPEDELSRLRNQRLAAIRQEKSEPNGMASRILPKLLYGEGHPYANPRSGSGTEASVAALRVEDLKRFRAMWLRPDNARLLIVGDTTLEKIKPMLEREFADWKAPDEPRGTKNVADVPRASQARVFLMNRTAADQSLILAAHIAPPKSDPEDTAMSLANAVLGGMFISRLNLNLREAKHWTYGAGTQLGGARGPRSFVAYAPVQTDKTAESIREIQKELGGIVAKKPITTAELKLAADNLVVGLPGDNETNDEVAGSYLNILQFGLKDSYYDDLVPEVMALKPAQVNAAAKRLVHPESLTWVIVGDLSKIEAPVRALKLGEVKVLDADGNPVR